MSSVDDDALAAYHEAGHVVVAHLAGGRVVESTIESEHDGHRGHTVVAWTGVAWSGAAGTGASAREAATASALAALGGPIAETLWLGDEPDAEALSAWRADWDEVEAALDAHVPVDEREGTRSAWIARVVAALRDAVIWERVCRVADHLEAHGGLEADDLDELLATGGAELGPAW